tara:strand:+ start:829 stop:1206 length:378 start_codon:yes stop_codon:yes gene_type:complete
MTFVEILAIILLSLALIKNGIGMFWPKHLIHVAKRMQNVNILPMLYILLAIFIYGTYTSGVTLSEWLIAAYSGILLFVTFLALSGDAYKEMAKTFTKLHADKLRMMCSVVVLLAIYGLYLILGNF